MKKNHPTRRNRGFTLVELMVSLALGLLVTAVAISFFLSAKQSNQLQRGMAAIQENGRAVLYLLSRDIMMAGFPKSGGLPAFLSDHTADGGGTGSDSIGIQYESPLDCIGNANPTYDDGKQYNRTVYSVAGDALVCTSLDEDGNQISSQALIEGVDNLQILYGVDDISGDDVTNATRYVRADRVGDWDNVVSVRLAMLIATARPVAHDKDKKEYNLLGQGKIAAAGDLERRQAFQTTVLVRNRME